MKTRSTQRATKRTSSSPSPRGLPWLGAALDYIPQWIEFQVRQHEQPGCVIAIAHRDRILLEAAFGVAHLRRKTPLTPRHRFRVASHSKTFTSAAFMKLREQKRVKLDDTVGEYVPGLDRRIARATIAQLLSHSAGIVRDGDDTGQWTDDHPFRRANELLADISGGPVVDPNSRLKYSNHGYGLAGLVLESITGEPYRDWIQREIVDAAGLRETEPDTPLSKRRGKTPPITSGHSTKTLLGRRVVVPWR